MNAKRILAGLAVVALVVGTAWAGEALKSGPQAGEKLAGPFHPLNVTGKSAGEKHCLYCENGGNPVAMIFAREVTPTLTTLIKKVDEATTKNSGANMGSFVVFLNDEEGLDKKLQNLAKENQIEKTVLSIDNPGGPKDYNINQKADVTVVLYTERTAKANWAFKKGDLKEKDIDTILASIPKILPEK
jgi:hypothetical protein